MSRRPSLGIIGAGKVGAALARLWYNAGYPITAVYSTTVRHAELLAKDIGAITGTDSSEVVGLANLIVLTVPDDRIESVADGLKNSELAGKAVIHTSGVHDRSVLAILAQRGAITGSLHPAYPFASVETAVEQLPGATFALEADQEPLRQWMFDLVQSLNGRVLEIPTGSKALYHSALTIVSNYTVTLYSIAEQLLLHLGADRDAAHHALNTLISASVENLHTMGVPNALTGPLVRGDVQTVRAHLEALSGIDPRLTDLYVELAQLSFPMLQARGVAPEPFERLFRGQETNNAINNT
jgi:predicted short-subunit dehydrogenase-like oxidoreductase (DUF2520 family)